VITWLNRILFLKLLEAQLIRYHKGDKEYGFMKTGRIDGYDDLDNLFFRVLARKSEERDAEMANLFSKIPYLNSSLFEPTELEQLTIFTSNLQDHALLPIISSTVLKHNNGKKRTGKLSGLQYLFEFLDAYDFAGEGSEEIQEDNKTLINASVLGLIFEKINGYIQHYKIYSTSSIYLDGSKIGIILGYQFNHRQEFSHPQAAETPGLDLHLNTITYDLKYYLPELAGWEITPGVNGMYQINSNKGTEFIIPDYRQFDLGPFLLVKKSFKKIDISAGVRYDMRFFRNDQMFTRPDPTTGFDMQVFPPDTVGADKKFSDFKHTYSGLSASLGITYNIAKNFSAKVNVARGFRAPNIEEISANGVHPGTNMYQIGNSDFKPEFSLQGDLGLFYTSKPVIVSVEAFYNNISNYIFNHKVLNKRGQDSIIVPGNQTFKFQQSQAVLYGGEASLDIHFFKWMHFENSLSVVYAINQGGNGVKITDSSRYLPFIPPLHTHTELRVEFDKGIKGLSSIYARIAMEYYAAQNRAYIADNTETPTPGYTLFDAGIGGDVTRKNGHVICSIHLAVTNIFDVAYQSHLSRLKYFEPYPDNTTGRSGIYDMGRNISLKVIFPIDIRNKPD